MQLPITVVIPTMNRPESLERTVRLFAEGLDVPAQLIVVDQSEEVHTRQKNQEIIEKFKSVIPAQTLVFQEVPSLTKARNKGLEFVANDIVIFADDDIDVNTETVRNVFSIMSDKSIAMIAGIDELTSQSSTNIGYILGTKSYRKRKIGHVTRSMLGRYPDNITAQIETQWAQGYFFVVRKGLLEKWGLRWDENLTSYAYAEDLDFSFSYYKRSKEIGLRCVLDPRVKVKHLASMEYRIPGAKSIYMYIINRAYLSHKHGMGITGSLARIWCDFWRLVQAIVSGKNSADYLNAMKALVKYRKNVNEGHLDYSMFMTR